LPKINKGYSIRSAGKGLSVIERWDESPEMRNIDELESSPNIPAEETK
jgi:hypothetical protein